MIYDYIRKLEKNLQLNKIKSFLMALKSAALFEKMDPFIKS